MDKYHFISYSAVDALDFALNLSDTLEAGPPEICTWIDKRKLQTGADWDRQVDEAIRDCESVIFILSRDSVEDASICKNEWVQALRYKKPIVLARLHADATAPFRLNSRQHIDFAPPNTFDSSLARLRKDLQALSSPRGILQALQYRQADADRDLRRAVDPIEIARIQAEIAQLKKQLDDQKRIVEHPEQAAQQTAQNIQTGLERERQPEKPIGGAARSKFINPPPMIAPAYFQDRYVESQLIGNFLKDDAKRMMTINGRGGIGKTAMVCRLLKALESGQLPDDLGALSVDGIVYLSATGTRRINVPNLYADLCQLLPADAARPLEALYKDPQATTTAKVQALLAAFPQGRTVVLLDNFEELIDPETTALTDAELDEALRAVLSTPHHMVKVMLTTRLTPGKLALVQPGRQAQLHLEQGLDSPYAENILREMDADGIVGLKTASDAVLNKARERTLGYPRALEALYAILSADRFTTLEEVLTNAQGLLPENVVEALVGEAFNRLDTTTQRVMEALAIYARHVTPAAVDYLLQPYLPGINSTPVLNRLVNMHFVRKEGNRYHQHPVDLVYALSRIPKGEKSDRRETPPPRLKKFRRGSQEGEVYTQYALLHRGAEYFKQARQPRETWKKLDDLAPQLNEFELRDAGEDYDTAASVLVEIGGYLHLWGHYRLMIDLHEQLLGKIDDQFLQQANLGILGSAYSSTGPIHQAIRSYEAALAIAREMKDRKGEGDYLGHLSICYASLGQTARAIEYSERALVIAREIGDRRGEGSRLNQLGNCCANLGQILPAIEYYDQALAIAHEIGDRYGEGNRYGNLSICYARLGQTTQAIEKQEQALSIFREIGDRYGEGYGLGCLALNYVDFGKYDDAIRYACDSVKIGDEISSAQIISEHNHTLAVACLGKSDLINAHDAIESACRQDDPENNHHSFALLGVIALRQGDHSVAQQAFTEAIAHADKTLRQTPQLYDALDAKGLALCGLALCGDATRVKDAIAAYRAARAINKDAGVVKRALRLFDALAVADTAGLLAEVRKAAAGEE